MAQTATMGLTKTLRNRLLAMEGEYYKYASAVQLVERVDIDDEAEKVSIRTTLRIYDRKFESVSKFLEYWEPAEEPKAKETMVNNNSKEIAKKEPESDPALMDIATTTNDEVTDLIKILKDSIEKVKADKEYIKQSNAITSNVNAIINLKKTQLEIFKTARSMRKK